MCSTLDYAMRITKSKERKFGNELFEKITVEIKKFSKDKFTQNRIKIYLGAKIDDEVETNL